MIIEITETTLKRLTNYEAVMIRRLAEVEKSDEGYEKARARAQHIHSVVGYSLYLHMVQKGHTDWRAILGEPVLVLALVELMRELRIPVREAAEAISH